MHRQYVASRLRVFAPSRCQLAEGACHSGIAGRKGARRGPSRRDCGSVLQAQRVRENTRYGADVRSAKGP